MAAIASGWANLSNVQNKISAAGQFYQSCITEAKQILESVFEKPVSYYDGEKRHVLDIASRLFDLTISSKDIESYSLELGKIPEAKEGVMEIILEQPTDAIPFDFEGIGF